ncbi:AcrR family transcriptional regulator [Kineococcus radiotolerans]|uniref:AcrR family transcriptional regulator n=1 Tax=Kineococcus radiotolerans TaxID=131568 RepID=A0A7W4XZA2_KINRA|nr:TetR/AcrR family transcriptional regulator [Kineococcus radiotolerans]MBB2903362.1 AcrR family transcriptional regulator [Kineococcus radiotolerans]
MTPAQPQRPSPPRELLLQTASELFYREGINGVGVDRILQETGVTRSTLYRHFAGKEALIVAYLQREDQAMRGQFAAAGEQAVSPEHVLELIVEGVANDASRHHTRGCPFINATAEFPDPASPVRQVVAEHRTWFRDTLLHALTAAGRDDAATKADTLVMLRDAVLVGCYLDGAETVRRTFIQSARWVAGLR